MRRYADRRDAGAALARALEAYRGREDVLVLGLPRGGVPVAFEVARALGAPLDVMIVRKIGVPFHPELAMGAVASGGAVSTNHEVIRMAGVSREQFEAVRRKEETELRRREALYRGDRPTPQVRGRTVIVVDDGMATGASMRSALLALRELGAARVVAAVPVAPDSAPERLADACDEWVCPYMPEDFAAVGQFYERFGQTEDEEVRALLDAAQAGPGERAVTIELPDAQLPGDLVVPTSPQALVVFVHGSGSGRRSSRNRAVAAALQDAGLATLLFDLLMPEEDRDYRNRFDIPRLTRRLLGVTAWVQAEPALASLPIGYFGASTGAAAALIAAADPGSEVAAVVSRGGRPDLAGDRLSRVNAPTLLIVGGADHGVIELNEGAFRALRCEKELAVVPGATHLFEEPGALEEVARLAIGWLDAHCAAAPSAHRPARTQRQPRVQGP